MPKSLRKEREKRKMQGFKGEAPEGILCLFIRESELFCWGFLSLTDYENQEGPPVVWQMRC